MTESEITIKIKPSLFHKRNNYISNTTKNFWINCLGLIYDQKREIECLHCQNAENDIPKIIKIKLIDFFKENCQGISNNRIVEESAICINLSTIPLFFEYNSIEIIQVGKGADYICYGDSFNFVFESKGVNSKYNCPQKIREGKREIEKSFKIFSTKDLKFGIVGESCFYEKKHYLIIIENNSYIKKESMEMDEIQKLIEEKSKLISEAMTFKQLGKNEESKSSYKEAAEKEKNLALILEKKSKEEAIIHWISAISCALEGEDYKEMYKWIDNLWTNFKLSQFQEDVIYDIITIAQIEIKSEKERIMDKELESKILKYILLRNEEIHQRIRGKGNVIKELYFLRREIFKFGKNQSASYVIAKNPIFSPEISNQLQKYEDSKFLIRNADKTLNLNEKIKMRLSNEKNLIREIISKNFSNELLETIDQIVKEIGKLTSAELKKLEEEEGITSSQYGKAL